MDIQITPEPSPEEREAIRRALELEHDAGADPTPWREVALGGDAAAPEPGRGPGVIQP
jgi:hypothetical protein